jgi:hypothetical protein
MSSQAWFRLTEVQPIVIWGEVLALRYVRQRLSESRLFHLSAMSSGTSARCQPRLPGTAVEVPVSAASPISPWAAS